MADTLTERALRLDDAAGVVSIMVALELAEPVDECFGEQAIREELAAPGVDLARASVGVLDGDELIAFGWLMTSPPFGTFRAHQWAGVLPRYGGQGIGHRIVDRLEVAARALRDADAAGLPGELIVWIEEPRLRTAALVDGLGYQTWRYFFRMRCDLRQSVPPSGAPTGQEIAGLEICAYRDADEQEVLAVSNSSFADHWGSTPMDLHRWRAHFAEAASFRPRLSLVARLDGKIVSFVMTTEHEPDSRHRGYRTGYIARVGTGRAARGRGIASALLVRTLGALADAGYQQAELHVDAESPTGAGRLYKRVGFAAIGRVRTVGKRF